MKRNELSNAAQLLLSAKAVRLTSQRVYENVASGNGHFNLHEEKLPELAETVCTVIRETYPDMQIPFHARLRHFRTFNQDRMAKLLGKIASRSVTDRSKIIIDLIVVSVLLDAGAGSEWSYFEKETGEEFFRSEGLAIASFHMFCEGLFSMEYRRAVEGQALAKLPADSLGHGFQASDDNPIIGLEARARVLNRLGQILVNDAEVFPHQRPGDILEHIHKNFGNEISAGKLLEVVLDVFHGLWTHGADLEGIPMGDAWFYNGFEDDSRDSQKIIVFHKPFPSGSPTPLSNPSKQLASGLLILMN